MPGVASPGRSVRVLLGARPSTTLSVRLAARLWQLAAPHRPVEPWRVAAAACWAAVDVALVRRLGRAPEPRLPVRLALDAVDTAFWTIAGRGSPDHLDVAVVPALALSFEHAFRHRRQAWLPPLVTALAAEVGRLITRDPPKADRLLWSVLLAMPGLGLALVDRDDRRAVAARRGEIEATAGEAAEAALTGLATSTDSLADLVRDAAHKLECHGGPRAERDLVERWKEQRAAWIGAAGRSYLTTVLRTWEHTQSHPDLGTHVRFVVGPGDGLVLLDPGQQGVLLARLDERDLAGDVLVRVRAGRRADLDVLVGRHRIALAASGRLPPRPFDYAATTQAMTSALMLVPLLPGQGRVAWWAAVPPALVTAVQSLLAARRSAAQGPSAVRIQVAVSSVALAWHAVTAARTQRDHAAGGTGPVRAPFYLATAGQATLLALSWPRLRVRDRSVAVAVAVGALAYALRALPPRARVRLLLADLCWSAASAGLMRGVARSAQRVEAELGLEDDVVDAAVARARHDAAAFFSERIDRLSAVPSPDPELHARITDLLEEARRRCESLRTPVSSWSTTTRPSGPGAAPYWPGMASGWSPA